MNKDSYDDILNMPHHQSSKHPHMSNLDRAAQFSPFAALTGYEDAIRETARTTESRIELDEYIMDMINEKLQLISKSIEVLNIHPSVSITYFCPDTAKSGGKYTTVEGVVKKVNLYTRKIILQMKNSSSDAVFPIDDIVKIDDIVSVDGITSL